MSHCLWLCRKKNQIKLLRNLTFMMQCTKEDSGARLVNPWIMGKKRTFTVLGTFFFCPTFFFFFWVLGWWTNSMFWTHSSPFLFVAYYLYCIERLCVLWNIATSTVLRKAIKETHCRESRKVLDVSPAGKEVDCGVMSSLYSWQFCVSDVHFWFGKGDINYGGLPSSRNVVLS